MVLRSLIVEWCWKVHMAKQPGVVGKVAGLHIHAGLRTEGEGGDRGKRVDRGTRGGGQRATFPPFTPPSPLELSWGSVSSQVPVG